MIDEAREGWPSGASADLAGDPVLDDAEIRERMSGNICRCGAYPGIVAAIQEVHSGRRTADTWRFVDEQRLAEVRKEDGNEAI